MQFSFTSQKLALIFIVLAGFLVHSPMLGSDFKTVDDYVSINYNHAIRDLHNVPQFFKESFFKTSNDYYRPLILTTFALNYAAHGLNAFFFNLTDLILHLICALLVYFLILRIVKDQNIAFLSGLLFAIHPVQWDAVGNIAGRSIILCALFYFAAMLFYMRRQWWLCAAAFFLSLLSKESASTFLLVVIGYEFIYGRKKENSEPVQKIFIRLAILCAVFGVYILLRKNAGIVTPLVLPGVEEWVVRVLTFFRGMWDYLRLMFFPYDLHYDRSMPYLKPVLSFNLLAALLFIVVSVGAMFKYFGKATSAVRFLVIWLICDFLLYSQIVIPIGTSAGYAMLSEHFLYLPLASALPLLIIGVKYLGVWLIRQDICSKIFLKSLAVFFVIHLALITVYQEWSFSDNISMLRRSLEFNDKNSRVHIAMGLSYVYKNRFVEAEKEFRRALELQPRDERARIALGTALCGQGKYWEGLEFFEQVQYPGDLEELLRANVRNTYVKLVDIYQKKIKANSNDAAAHYSLGVAFSKLEKYNDAIKEFEITLSLKPDHEQALFNLGSVLGLKGDTKKAFDYYRQYLVKYPSGEFVKQIEMTLNDTNVNR
ncbi:MAG: tetratricopeptide repeat protein [Candidatus Omnitrophica bacterium]|nr:tetratricopeptide repeat protein [Candidatus Omnitrophota bacterium]